MTWIDQVYAAFARREIAAAERAAERQVEDYLSPSVTVGIECDGIDRGWTTTLTLSGERLLVGDGTLHSTSHYTGPFECLDKHLREVLPQMADSLIDSYRELEQGKAAK